MTTFDHIISLLPDSLYRKIHNLDYLRGALDSGYRQPWRAYHNYTHLEILLDSLAVKKHSCIPSTLMNEFVVAILFHDVVYDIRARSPENENASAAVANICGSRCISGMNWNAVKELILATVHDGKEIKPINQYMADIDLFTFELPYEQFRTVNALVQQEYEKFFSPELVRQGRLDFLKTFAKRPRIFYHDMIFSNEQAFKNIQNSIEELEGR